MINSSQSPTPHDELLTKLTGWFTEPEKRVEALLTLLTTNDPSELRRTCINWKAALEINCLRNDQCVEKLIFLLDHADPAIRKEARQGIIEVSSRTDEFDTHCCNILSTASTKPIAEAIDTGRVVTCIKPWGTARDQLLSHIGERLDNGTDIEKVAAAKACHGYLLQTRGFLSCAARNAGISNANIVPYLTSAEIFNSVAKYETTHPKVDLHPMLSMEGLMEWSRQSDTLASKLVQTLKNPCAEVRVEAARSLSMLSADASPWCSQLVTSLCDSDIEVRGGIVETLGYCRAQLQKLEPIFCALLTTERDVTTVAAIARALGMVPNPNAKTIGVLQALAALPDNEAELQKNAPPCTLVIGNDYVSKTARESLAFIEARRTQN